ncbi:cytochrome p450 monooxygenase [Sporothrix brasiliensis 5110]|uniref:Cytochrome p450 monooxygenase n=1 Tax=Sporothrix brasiliensis 5110 TaxID=1398154 RepID=A0A0C2IXK3_9PEZI|nr:cytochrome p450 monooxygenase [Sporothrix brasiliensis 5110]KIH89747.1 cytochrome p450 monooxygenase [Sporothrix brasiliensis 5110]
MAVGSTIVAGVAILPPSAYALLLVLALAGVAVHRQLAYRRRRAGLPLPPGPPAEPVLGHLRVIPAANPEYTYMQWSKEYQSDVLGFHILGQPIVVLNSARAAIDLLDKRGANYADRPRFVLFEAMGFKKTLTFLRMGPAFRLHRRILQKRFQKSAITVDQDLQTRETHQMLRGLLATPDQWETVLRRFATAVVLGIGFGIGIHSDADPYIQMAEDASYALGHGGAPAGTPVDYFPGLRLLPNWMVDRSLRFARTWRWAIRQLHEAPYHAVVASSTATAADDGAQASSLIHGLLAQRQSQLRTGAQPELSEDDIKGAAAAVYAAGQDTTWATMIVLILNLIRNPDVQRKAQRVLDDALGDRLPTFADRTRPELEYIEHIVSETLRWCPVSPVGVPHRTVADDEYRGMFIAAGAYVYANARAITHDPAVYADPDAFVPERYARGEPLPVGQFGFGRRVCVGQHLAQASVWIAAACLLKSFTLKAALNDDGDGQTTKPDCEVKLTYGLTSHPERFGCIFEPRGDVQSLVERAVV